MDPSKTYMQPRGLHSCHEGFGITRRSCTPVAVAGVQPAMDNRQKHAKNKIQQEQQQIYQRYPKIALRPCLTLHGQVNPACRSCICMAPAWVCLGLLDGPRTEEPLWLGLPEHRKVAWKQEVPKFVKEHAGPEPQAAWFSRTSP